MTRLVVDISVSLDRFVAGPNQSLEDPLGENGERLHDWVVATKQFNEAHGRSGEGGETGVDNDIGAEHLADKGATVMGRHMFSGGEGPWEDDHNATGWSGEYTAYKHPVVVLVRRPRGPL